MMDAKFSLDSCQWGDLLDKAVQGSKYIGTDSKGRYQLLNQGDSQKLSLKQIIDISVQFQNSDDAKLIASSLKIIAAKTEVKHYSGIWKILKLFHSLINGFKGQGFETTVSKANRLADSILNRTPQNESGVKPEIRPHSPVRYAKGEVKTRTLVPTVKEANGGVVGRGRFGIVHIHRDNSKLVVKKSRKDLETEYAFACQLKHPCIVETKQMFIKTYPNGTHQSKIVMERIEGQRLDYYFNHRDSLKVSNEHIRQLLEDAKETIRYLFESKKVWADVNAENIFVTEDGHLKLCDFGFWLSENNSTLRTKKLLLGAMEMVGFMVKCSNVRQHGKVDRELEKAIWFPKEFFKTPFDPPSQNIVTATVIQGHIHHFYNNCSWMRSIDRELAGLSDEEKAQFLVRYLDCVIANFTSALANQT